MDKMRIVMCDNNKKEMEAYARIVRLVCEKNDITPEVICYNSSGAMLFNMDDALFAGEVSILILDPEESSGDVLNAVRESNYNGLILCLSRSTAPECMFKAFEAKVFNYIQKGEEHAQRFVSVLKQALKAAENTSRQSIVVSYNGEYRQIELRDIYYCETTADHMVTVYYRGGSFEFPSSLSNLAERLESLGFARVHRSYIAALSCIRSLSYTTLTLNDGSELPVGRSYYPGVKKARENYNAVHGNEMRQMPLNAKAVCA